AAELARFRELIKRRLAGEPVAYLVGKKEFRSLELMVDARVLVPRPETETLVEVALELAPDLAKLVDIGTGSGAIALALKAARPDATVLAVDRSPDAAEVARANAERLGLAVEVRTGDLLAPVLADAPFDLIVSNPPYLLSSELPSLPIEVRHEPALALDGGEDGLAILRRLAEGALALLQSGGALVVEVADGQAQKVVELFSRAGYVSIETRRDLLGHERVVWGKKPGAVSAP
ncbi:MAG TPA: peptide chain release factor N(5)-glutamine methyltransferase, partial [Polyangia bacterium]